MTSDIPAPEKGGDRKNATAQMTAKQRQAKALELRTGGATYKMIAEVLNLRGGAPYAHRLVKAALADIPRDAADELRAVELERLDEIELRLRARLRSGDISVTNQLLRVAESRAKLTGIYQLPTGTGDLGSVRVVFEGFRADLEQQLASIPAPHDAADAPTA